MRIDEILNEIYSYSIRSEKKGLENIIKICNELGNPEKKIKAIHITGTNGKGSTATMIEKGLLEDGYRVGKFTSPHILKFNERIKINEKEITDKEVEEYYFFIKKIIEKLGIKPTFFEVITAIMFKYFCDKKVDYAVIEVGIGGRLDSTNVIDADYCIITNIANDHTDILGESLKEIAYEKAGIIKRKSFVVFADNKKELIEAIEKKTKNFIDIKKKYRNIKFDLDYDRFLLKIKVNEKSYILSIFGEYQVYNFLCAYEILKKIGVNEEKIFMSMKKIYWPGRFEIVKKDKLLILDGAHNEDGIKSFFQTLMKKYKKDDIVVITSILKDKEYKRIIDIIEKNSNFIIFTSLSEKLRGVTGKDLYNSCDNNFGKTFNEDINEAFNISRQRPEKVVVICGSFYLISKFKKDVLKNERA